MEAPSTPFVDEIHLAAEMIDSVRHAASISHEKSQMAVQKVIQILRVSSSVDI